MYLYTYVAFGFRMLKTNMWPVYKKKLAGPDLVKATTAAYLELDQLSLAQPKGLFGAMRERGLGGSKCGATAATVVLLPRQG
jgi:protein phosphatase 1L